MELLVKCVINFIIFPVFVLGLSSLIPAYYSIKSLVKNHSINPREKKMLIETLLISAGIILILIAVRWSMPRLFLPEILQNLFLANHYTILMFGYTTFEVYSVLFYFALIGFIYKIGQLNYGLLPKTFFIRKNLLPVFIISLLLTVVPVIIGI